MGFSCISIAHSSNMQNMSAGLLEWLVIGGGIHGTHLSHVLVTQRGESAERVRVLDRESAPLAVFWRCAEATGMPHMRSAGVHHLDIDPFSLLRFDERTKHRYGRLVPPYSRPQVSLFRAHCDHVIRTHKLDTLRLTASTSSITKHEHGFRVETSRGVLDARRVVLALGAGDEVAVPSWAEAHRAFHVFHTSFTREAPISGSSVAIVGGGISAVQLALASSSRGLRPTIVARHALRVHPFDSDPGWLGAKYMSAFRASPNSTRRAQIERARYRGSVPPDLGRALHRAIHRGAVRWVQAEVKELVDHGDSPITLVLDRAPDVVTADHLMLATGFARTRPGGRLIDNAITALGLPCASCGFPVVGETLEWTPGLFVTGALAELQLGPTARNIAGARAAGERLARSRP
ncbi:MAG: NAD(P)-binding domain-containing protein [Kofleriaceae bacterium]